MLLHLFPRHHFPQRCWPNLPAARSWLEKPLRVLLFAWLWVPALAHDVHESYAEAQWNAKAGSVEVSLTVFLDDFELALMRHSNRLIRLEKTKPELFDEETQRYLKKHFLLQKEGGTEPQALRWLGREMKPNGLRSADPQITLHFSFNCPENPTGLKLSCTLLTELYGDQQTFFFWRGSGGAKQLRFFRDQSLLSLP